jgi:5-methylcytosine-specific restriction protein A
MMTVEQKLESLKENDVWVFTKQTTDFDESFRMVKLFSDIQDIENVNIEQYFAENHERYGVTTDRHRALVIAQMFGLLTKNKFFTRGDQYKKEKTTAVFEELSKHDIGSTEYNTIKTEQLLKIRIKPIIDTTNEGYDQSILPAIFCFAVLWKIRERGINSISKDQFYTYVMTCKKYEQLDETIELLLSNPRPSDLVAKYKDKSRFETLLNKNCRLFSFDNDTVSVNDDFGEYFYRSFFSGIVSNMDKLNALLDRPVDYAYFLYNVQGFNVNLIDEPAGDALPITPHLIADIDSSSEPIDDDENYDANYVSLVDNFKEENINTNIGKDAYSQKPQFVDIAGKRSVSKNPVLGKIAIINFDYKCVVNIDHRTFESKKTHKDFMEAHHLIPIRYTQQMWDQYDANIDCGENLVSLCPNCHRAVHYGSRRVKDELLRRLYDAKQKQLKSVGIMISFEELLRMYP